MLAELERVFFPSGWWRLDSHDLGHRVQTCGPGEAASVQRSWHQHQRQGWLRLLSVFDMLYRRVTYYVIDGLCLLFLGRKYLPSLGSVLRQRGDRWAAPERPLWSPGRQHPWRLSSTHRCSGESSGLRHVSCLNCRRFQRAVGEEEILLVVDDLVSFVSSGFSCLEEQTCFWRIVREKLLQIAAATTQRPGWLSRPTGEKGTPRMPGSVEQRKKSFTGWSHTVLSPSLGVIK